MAKRPFRPTLERVPMLTQVFTASSPLPQLEKVPQMVHLMWCHSGLSRGRCRCHGKFHEGGRCLSLAEELVWVLLSYRIVFHFCPRRGMLMRLGIIVMEFFCAVCQRAPPKQSDPSSALWQVSANLSSIAVLLGEAQPARTCSSKNLKVILHIPCCYCRSL